jgi:hypothetical protein
VSATGPLGDLAVAAAWLSFLAYSDPENSNTVVHNHLKPIFCKIVFIGQSFRRDLKGLVTWKKLVLIMWATACKMFMVLRFLGFWLQKYYMLMPLKGENIRHPKLRP